MNFHIVHYMTEKRDSDKDTRESSMTVGVEENTIYIVFLSINEGINTIQRLTAS